jgi:hypothetical protein
MSRAVFLILGCVLIAGAQQAKKSAQPRLARDAFGEAVKSAREITDSSKRDHAVYEIAKAQARSDFLTEAVSTSSLAGKLRRLALVDVASVAAKHGEYKLAMQAVQGENRFTQDQVREEVGIEQARIGDVRAALLTADLIHDGYAKESVQYFASLELLREGDRAEADRVARGFKSLDHELPKESEVSRAFDWRNLSPPPTLTHRIGGRCDALSLLQSGKVAEAASCVEARPNPADVAADLARLAEKAAQLGNLDAALTFTGNPHLSGTQWEEGYIVAALESIGRLWATVDSSAALKWAETRGTEYQRAIALAGVAEGIATSGRPLD